MIQIPAASNPYVLSATAALEAVEVISPNRFVWLGQPFDVVQGDRLEDHPPSIRRLMLVRALVSHLYRWYFCPGVPVVPIPWQGSLGPPIMTERFRAALSRANRGRGLVEAGWNLAARNGAEARIERDGLTLRAPLESILSPPREKATVGSSVRVRLPNESLASSPGHYVALGNAPISHVGGRRLRFYWNLDADGAVALISQFSRALNREGVPYWIKALDNPALYDRRDSVLLCIQAEHGRRVIRIAERAIPALRLFLSPGVPAWTKPIAPGLGFAEDPPGGQSFGLHRCHLLAETIAVASERGLRGTRAKVRLLSRRFSDEGIDLNAPYSTRGAPDPPMLHARISIPRRRSVGSSPDGSFAGSIAWSICRRAIWSGGHCTWIETVPSWAGTARVEERSAPLGTDLYSGASGVALFLAEWSRLSGDRAARRTALGAIRGALDGERSRPCDFQRWALHGMAGNRLDRRRDRGQTSLRIARAVGPPIPTGSGAAHSAVGRVRPSFGLGGNGSRASFAPPPSWRGGPARPCESHRTDTACWSATLEGNEFLGHAGLSESSKPDGAFPRDGGNRPRSPRALSGRGRSPVPDRRPSRLRIRAPLLRPTRSQLARL